MKVVQQINNSIAEKNVSTQSWFSGGDQYFDTNGSDDEALMCRETDAEK
jgi:hypothetical protein